MNYKYMTVADAILAGYKPTTVSGLHVNILDYDFHLEHKKVMLAELSTTDGEKKIIQHIGLFSKETGKALNLRGAFLREGDKDIKLNPKSIEGWFITYTIEGYPMPRVEGTYATKAEAEKRMIDIVDAHPGEHGYTPITSSYVSKIIFEDKCILDQV